MSAERGNQYPPHPCCSGELQIWKTGLTRVDKCNEKTPVASGSRRHGSGMQKPPRHHERSGSWD
jgi:hypothetical protein